VLFDAPKDLVIMDCILYVVWVMVGVAIYQIIKWAWERRRKAGRRD